jgi:catalase
VFQPGSVPLVGRFSLGGGLPDQADKPGTVRGLGLLLEANGQQWRTAMINIPVFTDSTPQGFYERLLASKPLPDTGKPDPRKMADFLDRHPETAAAMKIIKQSPPSAGFADSTFYGLNVFYFTNTAGTTVPVRWSAVPQQAPAAPPAAPSVLGKDYLFDDFIHAVAQQQVSWRLVITIGEPGDPTNDATKPWPQSRRSVDAGTITISAVQTEEAGNARDINFDPLVLPDGITASDDPLPAARSAVYARSFTRRAEEPKTPSEVNVSQVRS